MKANIEGLLKGAHCVSIIEPTCSACYDHGISIVCGVGGVPLCALGHPCVPNGLVHVEVEGAGLTLKVDLHLSHKTHEPVYVGSSTGWDVSSRASVDVAGEDSRCVCVGMVEDGDLCLHTPELAQLV